MLDENITNDNQPQNKKRDTDPSPNQEPLIPEPEKESFWKKYQEVIVTLVILVAIALGFYFYAKKSKAPLEEEEKGQSAEELNIEEIGEINEGEQIGPETEEEKVKEGEAEATPEKSEETTKEVAQEPSTPQEETTPQEQTSQKTENSFIEEAQAGEGITHLARRALKDYLADKGGDAEITNEHKIYIEDYLQNKIGTRGLKIGEKVSFSFNLIEEAIAASKTLNQNQLKNLEKYSKLVFK